MLLYGCTVIVGGGRVDNELQERVMLERVELIARLASDGATKERDREIALGLIAELANTNSLEVSVFASVFSSRFLRGKHNL